MNLLKMAEALIAEEFAERLAGGCLSRVRVFRGDVVSAGEIEVFAVVAKMLLGNWIGAAIAALMGDACVVTDTIQTGSEIFTTAETTLAPARLT